MPDYEQWVRDGERVDMLYAHGIGRHGQGKVIGYTDRPILIVEGANGDRTTWIADMCKVSDPVDSTDGGQ